jgi:hypothetical protein
LQYAHVWDTARLDPKANSDRASTSRISKRDVDEEQFVIKDLFLKSKVLACNGLVRAKPMAVCTSY